MMDDIQEQTELADEISRAISEPAGFGMDVDEVKNPFRIRVVPRSLSPSCVMQKKIVRKNGRLKSWGREARERRDDRLSPRV